MLLIKSSDSKGKLKILSENRNKINFIIGLCYVETKSLDGENNLKVKYVPNNLLILYS
jgi:hypothetical protein